MKKGRHFLPLLIALMLLLILVQPSSANFEPTSDKPVQCAMSTALQSGGSTYTVAQVQADVSSSVQIRMGTSIDDELIVESDLANRIRCLWRS